MAHKTSFPDFHIHIPASVADVVVFVFSFVAIVAVAGLAAHFAPWS